MEIIKNFKRLKRFKPLERFEPLKKIIILILFVISQLCSFAQKKVQAIGTLKISFINTAGNDIPVSISDSVFYTNAFGEDYSIQKFKYYVSNIKADNHFEKESYHLVDASKQESLSFEFPLEAGNYNSLDFMLGVDSLRNCSGAQTGAPRSDE